MKIQDKTTAKLYENGKRIATNMFIEDAILAVHTSKNLEADIQVLANQYGIDIDVNKFVNELNNIKKGK